MITSLTQFVETSTSAISIIDCSSELIKEIQEILRIEPDGWAKATTQQAFADFKEDNQLEYPLLLGITTAKKLLEIKGKEESATVDVDRRTKKLNPLAGTPTGKSMRLPNGELVYENQHIVPYVPLTWGEVTACCTRVPTLPQYVENAIRLAQVWGEVRDKFGSPIVITSGYRPPQVNNAVGGVRNSQHLYFKALDMKPLNDDYKTLWEVLKDSHFVGLGDAVFMGRNKGFFHADIRPGDRVIFPY